MVEPPESEHAGTSKITTKYYRFKDVTTISTPDIPSGFDGVWVIASAMFHGQGLDKPFPDYMLMFAMLSTGLLCSYVKGNELILLADGKRIRSRLIEPPSQMIGVMIDGKTLHDLAVAKEIEGQIDGKYEFKLLQDQLATIAEFYRTISRCNMPESIKGKCDCCGSESLELMRIDSAQLLCPVCLRQVSHERETSTVPEKIQNPKSGGLTVPDALTRSDSSWLRKVHDERRWWPDLPDNTPMELLNNLTGARQIEMGTGDRDDVAEARTAILSYAIKAGTKPDIVNAPWVRYFFTKIVGVSHRNSNGSDGQAIIAGCSPFESLQAEHEDNPHDPNAFRVCRLNGDQIGYFSREVAADVWWKMQHGFNFAVIAGQITGGTPDRKTLGMNVVVVAAKPEIKPEEIQAYVDSIASEIMERCRSAAPDDDEDLN